MEMDRYKPFKWDVGVFINVFLHMLYYNMIGFQAFLGWSAPKKIRLTFKKWYHKTHVIL
jgi:hypothetical protein